MNRWASGTLKPLFEMRRNKGKVRIATPNGFATVPHRKRSCDQFSSPAVMTCVFVQFCATPPTWRLLGRLRYHTEASSAGMTRAPWLCCTAKVPRPYQMQRFRTRRNGRQPRRNGASLDSERQRRARSGSMRREGRGGIALLPSFSLFSLGSQSWVLPPSLFQASAN